MSIAETMSNENILVDQTTNGNEPVNQKDADTGINETVSKEVEDLQENISDEVPTRKRNKVEERIKKLIDKLNQANKRIKELESMYASENTDIGIELNVKDDNISKTSKYDEFIEFELTAQKLNVTPEEKIKAWKYAKAHPTLSFEDCFKLAKANNSNNITNTPKTVGTSEKILEQNIDYNKIPLSELEKIVRQNFKL